jgi:hypothetical protein
MLQEIMLCDFCSELLIPLSAAVSCLFVKQLFWSVTMYNVVVSAASTFDNANFIGEVTGSNLGSSTFYVGRGSAQYLQGISAGVP